MQLNWKEARILKFLIEKNGTATIRDISRACFPGVRPVEKADSQVRNSLRRIRDGVALVQRDKRGVFTVTEAGKAASFVVVPKGKKAKPVVGSRAVAVAVVEGTS